MEESIDKEIKRIRKLCIENAKDLLVAAKQVQQANIRYHLAVLALEEIGKLSLVLVGITTREFKEDNDINPPLDDHIKKIFWAFIGPSMEEEPITKESVEAFRRIAKRIHENRLESLYVDPNTNTLPRNTISLKEADDLVKLVEARIGIEESYKIIKSTEEDNKKIRWFLKSFEQPDKRPLIFGGKSIQKLAELKSSREWISWLYDQFKASDIESRRLTEEEMQRSKPLKNEADKPKWRMKLKIYSASHSLRSQPLNKWNENQDFIKLSTSDKKVYGDKKDELTCEFLFTKSMPAIGLWQYGWGLSRTFVSALNIGTFGFFWWHLPKDISRFYEQIWDIEKKVEIKVERNPILRIDWGHLTLQDEDLVKVSLVFAYLLKIRGTDKEESLNHYILGLTLLSKNDIHLPLEAQALDEFYQALKSTYLAHGDWDGKEDFIAALKKKFATLPDLSSVNDLISIAETNKMATKNNITLTHVFEMKQLFDGYFILKAHEKLGARTS